MVALGVGSGALKRALSDVSFTHMRFHPKRLDIESAKKDLKSRTLEHMGNDFIRLLYLSSLRDFSTGEYHHHGLAACFSELAANEALGACHEELFYSVVLSPLETLVGQVDEFIQSTQKDYEQVLSASENLQAYCTAVPSNCNEMAADLFRSNIKIVMSHLRSSRLCREEKSQSALPRLLLGQ